MSEKTSRHVCALNILIDRAGETIHARLCHVNEDMSEEFLAELSQLSGVIKRKHPEIYQRWLELMHDTTRAILESCGADQIACATFAEGEFN